MTRQSEENGFIYVPYEKELLSAIKLACHGFGVNNQSFSLLKGFFTHSGALVEKPPKSPQTLFFTFTFER
ncbi:hypothetical protein PMA4326_004045 [Pseudomonas syringae pv. maculicola str. ES4326]|uniref:Uncharacterized protein n=1 Tax=Pseudomonas syringae pv. maculicola str. ES4326 TaxID=629265 RepID=A0A8T8BXR6_PSEYM|nr:hypothetical protein PMA4326_004045 [Pseudomonas syringae pv. maculicola str. ES4326]